MVIALIVLIATMPSAPADSIAFPQLGTFMMLAGIFAKTGFFVSFLTEEMTLEDKMECRRRFPIPRPLREGRRDLVRTPGKKRNQVSPQSLQNLPESRQRCSQSEGSSLFVSSRNSFNSSDENIDSRICQSDRIQVAAIHTGHRRISVAFSRFRSDRFAHNRTASAGNNSRK